MNTSRLGSPGIVLIIALCLCLSGEVSAQSSGNDLTIHAGVSYFSNPVYDSVVLVEFPFTINRHEFEFFRPDSTDPNLYARVFAQVVLIGETGMAIDSASTYYSARAATRIEAARPGLKLFNSIPMWIKPGYYTARLTVIDVVSKRQGSAFYDSVLVEPIEKTHLTLGGMLAAYSVEYVGEDASVVGVMIKNGFKILANPAGVYSTEDSSMALYGELYNLTYADDEPSKFQVAYVVENEWGGEYHNFGFAVKDKPGRSAVLRETLDITGWRAGNYRLKVTATDLSTGQTATRFVPFSIISPVDFAGRAFTEHSDFDPYDTLSQQTKEHLVAYLLTPEEKATLDRLSDAGKLSFLAQYWREHDVDPLTPAVENRLDIIKWYKYANQFFSANTTKTDGWHRDRGRIYMTYGPPEQVDDRHMPLSGNAYIVWHYHSLREGLVFVFEDKEGFEDYTLVHSNADGEVFDKAWEEALRDIPSESY